MRAWLLLIALVAGCGRFGFDAPADAAGDVSDGVTTDTSAPANFVFVTSTATPLDVVNGIGGADQICNVRAAAAGLPGTYVAWLSTPTANARDRLGLARGWVRVDGKPFADTVADLTAGKILYPPRLDELGTDDPAGNAQPVTGTNGAGVWDGNATCGDYVTTSGTVSMGVSTGGTQNWTANLVQACSNPARFYCFGIDHDTPVSISAPPIRRAFVSQLVAPGGGRAALDARCQMDATAAGLTGTFLALVATSTQTAASRFVPPGWQRVDGVLVTTDLTAFAAPLDVTAAGLYQNFNVYTGASTPQLTAAEDCMDWTSTSGTISGRTGQGNQSSPAFFNLGASTCNGSESVYCFEQ